MKRVFLSGGWVESKYSTSWILGLLLVVNYTLTGYLVQAAGTTYGLNPHLYDVVSSTIIAATLLFSSRLVAKTRLSRYRQVMTVWFMAASFPMIPVGIIVHFTSSGSETLTFVSRAPTQFLSVLASCYIYSLLTAALAEGLSRSRELRESYFDLLAVKRRLSSELDELSLDYSRPAEERLKKFVNFQKSLPTQSPSELAEAIFEFSGKDLRSNASEIAGGTGSSRKSGSERRTLIGLAATASFTKVTFSQSFGVVGMTIVAAAYFVASFLLLAGIAASAALALSLIAAVLIWILISLVVRDRSARWWIWALINGGIYFIAIDFTIFFAYLLDTEVSAELVLATSSVTALLATALSSLESLVVRRQQLQHTLIQWNQSLEESSNLLSKRLNLVRSNVAKHLHSNIQAQLVVLGLKLKSQGDEWTAEGFTRNLALDSLSKISEGVELTELKVKSFGSSLAELKEFWDGALEISIELEKEAEQLLSASVELSGRVLNVLRECLTNAAKHSLDGTVRLLLLEDSGTVQLRSINRIAQNSNSSEPTGLGTKTIEDAASSWQATVRDGEYVFEARF